LVKSLLCYNKNSVKKILSYILITLILSANFLAPISVGFSGKNIEVRSNKAEAATEFDSSLSGYMNAFPNSSIFQTASNYINENSAGVDITVVVDTGIKPENDSSQNWIHVKAEAGAFENFINGITLGFVGKNYNYFNSKETFIIQVIENNTKKTGWIDVTGMLIGSDLDKRAVSEGVKGMLYSLKNNRYFTTLTPSNQDGLSVFKPDTDYTISLYYLSSNLYYSPKNENSGVPLLGLEKNGPSYYKIATSSVKTASKQNLVTGKVDEVGKNVVSSNGNGVPACGLLSTQDGTPMGCVAQGFYYVLFVPTSYLFALAGTMFDYTFNYSVQDTSYKSAFVVQGWGLIRDLCNMLFIFIMLYVAIGTTLSLHSMKTKETIVNVVIIGLFINFSLFATQLIIDTSNIAARVFYNSNTIKITEKGANGVAKATPGLEIGADGTIPLSAAIVNKVNPQNLILSATKVNSNNSTNGVQGVDDASLGIGQFILVVIMASAVNIVGFTVFITIAFLFIARVIGLWLAMILSPLAFFTYILPEMASTKMIGWKNWWPDTLKMAFLAPVFIFFMYIILKFLQADLITDIAGKSLSGDGLGYFVAILVPFAFIMILMLKAKKIATDMSGEFGEIVTKAGSAVGGLALGAATGGAAFAMRGTIGALGDKVANSDWAKTHGRLGNMVQDAGKWTASKSFDVRKTAFGTMAGKEMGVDMGKATEGGYAKHKTEITEKRRARAESKKLGNNSKEVQALHTAQEDEANLKNKNKNDIDRIDGTLLAKKRVEGSLFQALQSANAKLAKEPQNATYIKEAKEAQDAFDENAKIIKDHEAERKELNSGTGRHWDKTSDGRVDEKTFNNFKTEASDKETTFKSKSASLDADIKTATDKVESDITKAEAELNTLKQALVDETAIANPASPQDMALLQKTKDEVAAAETKFNTLNTSKEASTTAAEEGVRAALAKVATENTKAQETLSDMQKKVDTKGTSTSDNARSLDGLGLKVIPHLHHEVEKVNAARLNEYAKEIRGRWFSNKEANDIAAHEAIMRSEIKKH
jgi:hypothetical protein